MKLRCMSPWHMKLRCLDLVAAVGYCRSVPAWCAVCGVHPPAPDRVYVGMLSPGSNNRVKGRGHTVEKRISIHPNKPHATSQPSRFSNGLVVLFTFHGLTAHAAAEPSSACIYSYLFARVTVRRHTQHMTAPCAHSHACICTYDYSIQSGSHCTGQTCPAYLPTYKGFHFGAACAECFKVCGTA